MTAEPARSGWAQADCSAALLAGCSIPVDCSAGVSPDGSIPDGYSAALLADGPVDCSAALSAAQARFGWAQADCSAGLSAGGSIPPGRGERRCSLDALLAYWPMAQLRHVLEGYKVLLPLWRVRLSGR